LIVRSARHLIRILMAVQAGFPAAPNAVFAAGEGIP
jgi:hypothetical protein